jgi:hypothetical protein
MNDRMRMTALAVLVLAVVAIGAWFEVRGRQSRHAPESPAVTQPAEAPAGAPATQPSQEMPEHPPAPDDELVG